MRTPLFHLDAFASALFRGNPAAVMPFERFPDAALMQAVAAENNLSETAFLVPEGRDYRIRWFTPAVEVPLCGHATLASAAVVMERLEPGLREVVFHSASGPLPVRRTEGGYAMDFPARPVLPSPSVPGLSSALGEEPTELFVDPFNYMAVLTDAESVRRLTPDIRALARLDRPGVIVTAPGDKGYDCVSRYFAPAKGIDEDPVTGGAHCSIAPFWAARLGRSMLRAYQASKRGGALLCRVADDRVELEGACAFYLEGIAELPEC